MKSFNPDQSESEVSDGHTSSKLPEKEKQKRLSSEEEDYSKRHGKNREGDGSVRGRENDGSCKRRVRDEGERRSLERSDVVYKREKRRERSRSLSPILRRHSRFPLPQRQREKQFRPADRSRSPEYRKHSHKDERGRQRYTETTLGEETVEVMMIGRSGKEEEIEDLSDQEVDPRIEEKADTHKYSSYTPTHNLQLSEVLYMSSNQPSLSSPCVMLIEISLLLFVG